MCCYEIISGGANVNRSTSLSFESEPESSFFRVEDTIDPELACSELVEPAERVNPVSTI